MESKSSLLYRLTQAIERGHLVATVIKLYGYKVVERSLPAGTASSKAKTCLTIDEELFHVCSPVFKIEDEARVWKLKLQEYDEAKELTELEKDSVSLGDIRIQIGKTRKIDITGDPDGSQLRQVCQRGIIEDIENIVRNCECCNLVLNLCDVPYPRPNDLCDRSFSSSLLELCGLKKVLVVHPKADAEICGVESGLEGTWSRYLATDMVCVLWKSDESYFRKFEKKYLKQVVRNGMHDVMKKGEMPATAKEKEDKPTPAKEKGEMPAPANKKEEKPTPAKKKVEVPAPTNKKEDKPTPAKKKGEKPTPAKKKGERPASAKDKGEKPTPAKKKGDKPEPVKKGDKPAPVKKGDKPAPAKKGDKPAPAKKPELATKCAKEVTSSNVVPREKAAIPLLQEIWSHPVFRGICLTLILLAFYSLSSEILVSLLLVSASVWFKYGSKKPEFKKYTRSSDPRVLAFRRVYEKEIEKLRYARDLKRMRCVHVELKESVLNAYAVNRVSTGDTIGVEDHEELERELELTFKEFVTENDVRTLLHEAHYTSFVLAFTVFLYAMSRFVYRGLGKVWRPVRTVAVIFSVILLCFVLYVVSHFLSTSVFSTRLVGAVEMLSLVFGLWLVTDVTGVLIEIRACIDHVTGVIWREVELEMCIVKSPSYMSVKHALDCSVLLAFFPLVYYASGILSIFDVSNVTMDSVSVYFPPGAMFLRLCTHLAFFGRVLRFANMLMCVSLASKFYGLHKKRDDPLDAQLYDRLGYGIGSITERIWKPILGYLNDLQ